MTGTLHRAIETPQLQYPIEAILSYYGFSIATILGLLVFEAVYFGWEQSALKRLAIHPSPSARTDLALNAVYLVRLAPIAAVILSFGTAAIVPTLARNYFGYALFNSIRPMWAQVLLFALLYDFLFYWKHRISHRLDWWWQIHEVHHSAVEFNLITANRLHPMDEAMRRLFTCLPLALAGMAPEQYLIIRGFQMAQLALTHSRFPWDWGWVGRNLLVSPAAHRIHHSDLPEHRGKNFGNFTPLWDRLFGTWYEGPRYDIVVDDRPHYHRRAWYADVWAAYARFGKGLWRALVVRGPLGR